MNIQFKTPMKIILRQWLEHSVWALGTALIYMVLLHELSSIPGQVEPEGTMKLVYFTLTPAIQNLLHIPAFALLALLWSHVLPTTICGSAWVLLLTGGYGAYDEWFQLSVPGRFGSLTDWVLDLFGALIGIAIYRYLVRRKRNAIPRSL